MNAENLREQLSMKQIALLSQLVAKHDHISLQLIDDLIYAEQIKAQNFAEQVRDRKKAEGIDIGVINACIRVNQESRSNLEQSIVTNCADIEAVQRLNSDIDRLLEKKLETQLAIVSDWKSLRTVFLMHYEEAATSPRLSRAALEENREKKTLLKSSSASRLLSLSPRWGRTKNE